jgi:serine/threonine-protein kinase
MRPAFLLVAVTVSLPLAAQAWPTFFSAYQDGLTAQGLGEHALASRAFTRAIALNPRPGQGVRTYGLNFLSTYHPYLRLAESALALGDLDTAEKALNQSAALGGEPSSEREGLAAKVRTLRTARAAAPAPQERPAPEKPAEKQVLPAAAVLRQEVEPLGPEAPGGLRPASPGSAPQPYPGPQSPASSGPSSSFNPKGVVGQEAVLQAGGQKSQPAAQLVSGVQVQVPTPSPRRRREWGWLAGGGAAFLLGGVAWFRLKRRPAAAPRTLLAAQPAPAPELSGDEKDPNLRRAYGPFVPVGVLGQGGCATAYLGRHRDTGREVAIKVPHRHLLQDEEFKARFHREASLGALLDHPRIVPILDPGPQGGDPWLVMPFIRGLTLDVHLERKVRLEAPEAIRIGAEINEAISFAHSRGVVHRDLKPGNIMLTDGGAMVMDFGIARVLDATLTVSSMFMGTPLYSAPECVLTPRVGPAADRYALGILLFQCLSGRPPFQGESPFQILDAHRNEPLPDLEALCPGVPPALHRLIQRLCAKAPEARPEDGETQAILDKLR